MSGQKLPNNALDDVTSAASINMRRRVIENLNQLADLLPIEAGPWTPVVQGSSTAGTYEISSNLSRYMRVGRRVWVDVWFQLAAGITAGGTGDIQIIGAPFKKMANTLPQGTIRLDRVAFTANSHLVLSHSDTITSVASLQIIEVVSNVSPAAVPVSALAADDIIIGSICFETDDP
jgi:hypothetical protein